MWASGLSAPAAWFFTATMDRCSFLVPNSYMWRRAIIANSEAKVDPTFISPEQSPASARIWLTRAVGWEVIFSTPTTSTRS